MSVRQGAESRSFDVLVVGNGALGLSLALVLTRRGQRVGLLGQPHRPWAGSTAAGAMLGSFGEVTTSLVASQYGRQKLELGMKATAMWPEWLAALEAEVSGADIKTAEGTTVILNAIGTSEIDDANFAVIREELDRYEQPFEDIDPVDLDWVDAEPISRPLRAFQIPNEHAVNSAALLERLEAAFVKTGGTLVTELAAEVTHTGDQVTGVTLANGERLTAGQVVLAAGARTQKLLDTLPVGPRIPRLVSGYGVSALMRTADGTAPRSVIRTPNRSFACGLHVVPRGEGQVYLGATNILSPEPRVDPEMRDLVFLLQCAHRQVRRGLWDSEVAKVQVGNRPVSVDGFPLLGEGGMENLWIMTGTYRDGLHLSPLLSQEIAARMLGEEPTVDLDTFTPVRQPLQAWTREQVIQDVVDHTIGIGYEQDWTIPVDWHGWIEKDLHPATAAWAEELDAEFTPPAELLFLSRLSPEVATLLRDYYAVCRKNR
ncbi:MULTISPECIES: NAD(P)/FAD-dependent oxidoreductase [Streptomyces]|uniref:NAD(P)/FAD-dependent oxidoreductase n=1 Tax=Streptomyces TaxID=1883 RepID=UPI0022494B0D|nr:FAD-dependent oxidoreductase [Streptomyces sp. JHD 1]MCX2968961.1 FAD-dependent oxidoreductase [Streptomyces sp. JHD 1]